MTDPGSEQAEGKELSQPKRYDKRIEEWILALRDEAGHRAPEVLSGLASTAKSVAQYLEDLAEQTRAKQGRGEPAGGEGAAATEGATATEDAAPKSPTQPESSSQS
jgi:hypothetical protein